MTLHKGDYVFYYWKGQNSGPRLVKIAINSSDHIIGIALIATTGIEHRPIDVPLNNPNIDHLQYIPSDELHLHPHLFI